jgi:hypothetical protein
MMKIRRRNWASIFAHGKGPKLDTEPSVEDDACDPFSKGIARGDTASRYHFGAEDARRMVLEKIIKPEDVTDAQSVRLCLLRGTLRPLS